MKKLVLVFVSVAITAGAYAQGDTINRKMSSQDRNVYPNQNVQYNSVDKAHPDGVMMQNGKMMMVKNGQVTSLDHDMTMSNGTKVMSDGSYLKKDGIKMLMKEGQHLDMSGNLIPMKANKSNMFLVPDSTRKKDK